MKKILSTVAALGMVAGMATAAQALEFSVSGYYFVEGTYLESADGSGVTLTDESDPLSTGSRLDAGVMDDDDQGSDSYWNHEFVIKPVMKVNDKIVMKSKIYLASDKLGQDDLAVADGGNVKVHHLYMEYTSPIGMLRVGRTSAGLWQGAFLSTDSYANRIMYFPNFLPKPLGACVFIQKSEENDSAAGNDLVDSDYDLYEASAWYKTKDLKVALAYDYYRDASGSELISAASAYALDATTGEIKAAVAAVSEDVLLTRHRIKGYYNQNFGNIYAEMEFSKDWGEYDVDERVGELSLDEDIDTFAFMADVGMTMDKLDIGMMFIYASGDDDDTDDDLEAAMASGVAGYNGLGEQFQPYQILTGRHTGMLSNDVNGTHVDMTWAGIMSLGVHADFAVTDKLSLHSAIAYAQADIDEVKDSITDTYEFDEEYGWEIDLGVSYALLDNLTYSVDFGYLMAGDFFEGMELSTATADNNVDAEDVFVLNHRLSMEF